MDLDGITWSKPPERLSLAPAEVHVWLAALEPLDTHPHVLAATLDATERAQAARFRRLRDRWRFVAARGILRMLLGAYLHTPPANIALTCGAHGKPRLAPAPEHAAFRFNVAHSHTYALIALARDVELGVDIEHMRNVDDLLAVARSAFSPHERAVIATLEGPRQQQAFYACWTRKEAYIKAIGRGLSFPLERFDVAPLSDEPARLLAVRDNPADVERWHYYPLPSVPSYAAALVVESATAEPRYWKWGQL